MEAGPRPRRSGDNHVTSPRDSHPISTIVVAPDLSGCVTLTGCARPQLPVCIGTPATSFARARAGAFASLQLAVAVPGARLHLPNGWARKASDTAGLNRMTQNASGLAAQESPSQQDASQAVEVTDRPDRDRIAEAYLGRWGSAVTQQRARDRVDWMAACAQGPRVLDIGCSEGMLGLLLARAGHQVLGIDFEPAAIAAARDLLGAESSAVRARVELRVADALSVELDEHGFDTAVLGEVIEHLDQPSKMLARAAALLKPPGRLVLTTPFGSSPVASRQLLATACCSCSMPIPSASVQR
jgi:2-polyprenyl-3-methyl-5-hydroxy-6-metoxy-1,4-benzoquinol methylase